MMAEVGAGGSTDSVHPESLRPPRQICHADHRSPTLTWDHDDGWVVGLGGNAEAAMQGVGGALYGGE
jgi:hypothetical protein